MPLINLAGQKFSRLTVLYRAESSIAPSGQRRTRWICRCDCGALHNVDSQNLRTGKVQSCGCLGVDMAKARAADLTGRRFGRLVAEQRGGNVGFGETTWECRCDCGNSATVRTQSLLDGHTMSCGCLHRIIAANRRWLGEMATYGAVHFRLRSERGPAKSHACKDCGQKAREWSYEGGCPNERFEFVNGYWLAFTADPSRYAARCLPCHRRHDAALRKARAA